MSDRSDTTNFTDFQLRLREHVDHSKQTDRPLLVTSNGEAEVVVLSPKAYEELLAQAEMAESLKTIDESMEDIRAGRTQPAEVALREIADELGLKLNR